MMEIFLGDMEGKARGALFMSGSGSNAEKTLAFHAERGGRSGWTPVAVVTDAPDTSRAADIAEMHGLPLVALDIRAFYRDRGETRISLATERGRGIREEWTDELRSLLAPFELDFGILAGFMPLTNITSDFPCLNVHPGDLTVEDASGSRTLVGLHTVPVERAIFSGFDSMRSSVIIAQTYTGAGGEMDTGPILGVSTAVEIDLQGESVESLAEIASRRPEKKPKGGFGDRLDEIAKLNQERLKEDGDWVVLPRVVDDFASGRFALEDGGTLLHKTDGGEWLKVKTVEYGKDSKTPWPA
jgi:folate-dependent phosphoribosylglycinamide formyltransferase PurN